MARMLVARLIVAVLIGLAVGYAIGRSTEADAGAVVIRMIMIVATFGVYELLVYGMDKLLGAIDRRRNDSTQPGTPPPW